VFRFVLDSPSEFESTVERAQEVSAALGASVEKSNVVDDDDCADSESFVSLHILKDGAEPEQRLVYGEVLIPEEWDRQQDIISAMEIEKAAHRFLEEFQQLGFNHKGMLDKSAARIVESYIAPCDLRLNERDVKKGTWVLVTKVYNDTLWDAIKKGEVNGYSVGGKAEVKWAETEYEQRPAK
jgi:DNA adenine methylase